MNNLCCGAPGGVCTRHMMNKTPAMVQLCNGTSGSNCSSLYWDAWERGRAGATVEQSPPILSPPGFCSGGPTPGSAVPCSGCVKKPSFLQRARTAGAAYANFAMDGLKTTSEEEHAFREATCAGCPLNDNGVCNGCGCVLSEKIKMRLETCPAGKWFPDIHERRPLDNPTSNLLYHVLPVSSNENWKWNMQQLALRWHKFTGKKCLSINFEPSNTAKGRLVATVEPDVVINYCAELGMEWDAVRATTNGPTGEVIGYGWLLDQVQSTDSNTITFYGHAKGVTRGNDPVVRQWTDMMYKTCLDNDQYVKRALEQYSMVGSMRVFGQFKLPANNEWHYAGTFFWFRNDDVFNKPSWRTIDNLVYGVEAWPGRMFRPEKTACLFADDHSEVYSSARWQGLERDIAIWEQSRI